MRRHMHSWTRMRSWMHRKKRRRTHRRSVIWTHWNDWSRQSVWNRPSGKKAH